MKTLKDIEKELKISPATLNNWLKLGVIRLQNTNKHLNEEEFQEILLKIKKSGKLTQRTNRTQKQSLTDSSVLNNHSSKVVLNKIIEITKNKHKPDSIACAICLILLENKNLITCNLIKNKINIFCTNQTFQNFINDWYKQDKKNISKLYAEFKSINFPDNALDFAGYIYESIRSVADKSQSGAYFTPSRITKEIIIPSDEYVIDPCSGTGSLILNIVRKNHDPQKILLRDIDLTALRIAKVNFVLFFGSCDKLINTKIVDITNPETTIPDYCNHIITNPPYGLKLNSGQKRKLIKSYPEIKSAESFSIALLKGIQNLKPKTKLIYILPESVLYVKQHYNIRKLIFSENHQVKIYFFGQVFKGVMSRIIRLEISYGKQSITLVNDSEAIQLEKDILEKNEFRPPKISNSEELKKIKKILKTPSFNLKNKCKFGLGIVTGNNNEVLNKYPKDNDFFPIYTGKELKKFVFHDAKFYFKYNPEILQQCCKYEKYTQKKICYKFISDTLITAYDDKGRFLLNSINFFIINDNKIPPKALSAFLNSEIVSFIFKALFNSQKVLYHHIEQIPIPNKFYDYTNELENLYNKISSGEKTLINELNKLCENLYN